MIIALFAAAALAQATPSATPPAPAATPAPAAAAPQVDKVICKSLPQTGSLFAGPKECHRKSEWDAINAASRDDLNGYQQRTNQGSSPPR